MKNATKTNKKMTAAEKAALIAANEVARQTQMKEDLAKIKKGEKKMKAAVKAAKATTKKVVESAPKAQLAAIEQHVERNAKADKKAKAAKPASEAKAEPEVKAAKQPKQSKAAAAKEALASVELKGKLSHTLRKVAATHAAKLATLDAKADGDDYTATYRSGWRSSSNKNIHAETATTGRGLIDLIRASVACACHSCKKAGVK